jgi:hypothetical protein
MRGSPLFRALLTLAALVLAAWPVWRITQASAPVSLENSAPTPSASAAVKPRLQLEFLPTPPLDFEVKYLGQSIWRGGGKQTDDSPPLEMKIPDEGVDLQIAARWPAEIKSAAVRVRLVTPDGGTIERQAWTRDSSSLDDVLTFQSR